jgi:anthranilate phosphoribosyltransferase
MIQQAIAKVVDRTDLTEDEMVSVMSTIMDGAATGAQIGAFLTALRMKGETVTEIAAAAQVMRERSTRVPVGQSNVCLDRDEINVDLETIVDTCGTGGDGTRTFNVSTTTAFVVAGAGLKVAKHGNRSVSSKCGSADVVETLGVPLDLTPEQVGECIDRVGIGFLYAPMLHSAMRHVIGPRREIGMRTLFNLLGPLTNPARASVQVLGVYDDKLTEPMARVLGRLGCGSAFVVHGEGSYDEISITGSTRISRLNDGDVTTDTLVPDDFGIKRAAPEDITGGDAEENAVITRTVLQGQKGPRRDMVVLNSAAALVAAKKASGFREGIEMSCESIDSGSALSKLQELIAVSRELSSALKAAAV